MTTNTIREITYLEAVREAMVQEMRLDKEVFLIGEDIGTYGGAFGVSKGMLEEFGAERVRDTPISEAAIAGAATGAAAALAAIERDPAARRRAGGVRLVYGRKRPRPSRRSQPIPPRRASGTGAGDLCGDAVDRTRCPA